MMGWEEAAMRGRRGKGKRKGRRKTEERGKMGRKERKGKKREWKGWYERDRLKEGGKGVKERGVDKGGEKRRCDGVI